MVSINLANATALILVTMLMLIGYSPEVIQAAYRIGDPTTNIISPMMLPYTIFFLLCWSTFFYLWTFILGIPVGPGSPTF